MKQLAAILFLLFSLTTSAQQYRLNYDPSTIPELYYYTEIFLEKQTGNRYTKYPGKYRIHAEDGSLRGLRLSYSEADLKRTAGNFRFLVDIGGERVPLTLKLPLMEDLRFNFYTDSIKPVLNFYVNVEGIYSSGQIFPLTEEQVTITSDFGKMCGMEWIPPKIRNFDSVVFTATSKSDPALQKSQTVYLKRSYDPRDAKGYEDRKQSPPQN